MDVAIGVAVGTLAGLLFWPRGGGGQLRRDVAACLERGSFAVEETVETMAGSDRPRDGLDAARRAMALADASFCQYHTERQDPRMSRVDWEAALAAGNQMVRGAESLLGPSPPGSLAVWPGAAVALTSFARRLRLAYADLATQLRAGRITRPVRTHRYPRMSSVMSGGSFRQVTTGPRSSTWSR